MLLLLLLLLLYRWRQASIKWNYKSFFKIIYYLDISTTSSMITSCDSTLIPPLDLCIRTKSVDDKSHNYNVIIIIIIIIIIDGDKPV